MVKFSGVAFYAANIVNCTIGEDAIMFWITVEFSDLFAQWQIFI